MTQKITKKVKNIFVMLPVFFALMIHAEDTKSELLENPKFEDGTNKWRLESYGLSNAKIDVAPEGPEGANALIVEVGETGSGDIWKVQVSQKGFAIHSGKKYRLTFWAKCTVKHWFHVGFGHYNSPWGPFQGAEGKSFPAQDSWKDFTYEFTPTVEESDVRLLITNLNQVNTKWSFANFSLVEIDP